MNITLERNKTIEVFVHFSNHLFKYRYDEKRDIPAVCRTSDINEELGLVTHLFADKTGNVIVLIY